MTNYIIRRLFFAFITLIGVTLVTFLIVYAVPADPAASIAGPYADNETVLSIRHQLGLDRPLYVQYGLFLWKAVHGDFGTSFINNLPVVDQIMDRFPATIELGLVAFLAQLIIGLPLGALAASRQNSWTDNVIMTNMLVGLSLPRYWLGVVLMFIFAFKLDWLPLGGRESAANLVLPALTMGITGAAFYARLLRSSMIEIKSMEYVLTARSKGISEKRILFFHIMRNSLIPVVTWAGIDLASFLGGLIIVEAVFAWPGLGQLTFQGIQNMDIPLIMGTVLFSAILVVLASLIVDIVYVFLDPRISYEQRRMADAVTNILQVNNLSVCFFGPKGQVIHAVDRINLTVGEKEVVGLVGESGCGKSATGLSILRLIPNPPGKIMEGEIRFGGLDLVSAPEADLRRIRGGEISMIFQDPMTSLNPTYTIGWQIKEMIQAHERIDSSEAYERVIELLRSVGIAAPESRVTEYPHRLSGGMRQRVMIANALACRPKLLIADEPTTALDVTVQAQILDLLRSLQSEFQTSILLVSHDLGMIADMANRLVVMYAGQVVEEGPVEEIFARPLHPYTEALLESIPGRHEPKAKLRVIPGRVPNMVRIPAGCRFQPRCRFAGNECSEIRPEFFEVGPGHRVRCLLVQPGRATSLDPPIRTESISMGDESPVEQPDRPARFFLEARNLKMHFPIRKGVLSRVVGHVKAVDGVSFRVEQGQTFGLVGETACGKSTTARLLVGLLRPNAGHALFQESDIWDMNPENRRKLHRQIQMVFQDPYASLNPRMRVGDIISEPLVIYREGTRKDRLDRASELLELVGLDPRLARRFPHEFSGGQRQRIGIARALALNPAVMVCDEPVSALDVSIQSQILNLLRDLQCRLNLTYVFISHDLSVVQHICDRVGVMYLGKIVEIGSREDVFSHARHPYTKALLSAAPIPDPKLKKQSILLQGEVPSPINPPSGCHFHPRCPFKTARCSQEAPTSVEVEPDHFVHCYLAEATG